MSHSTVETGNWPGQVPLLDPVLSGIGLYPGLTLGEHDEGLKDPEAVFGGGGIAAMAQNCWPPDPISDRVAIKDAQPVTAR